MTIGDIRCRSLPLMSFDDAQAVIPAAVTPLGSEDVALDDAHGRVTAEPIVARIGAPRSAVSAMDGYAVADAKPAVGACYKVIGTTYAGQRFERAPRAGETVRAFTGAPLSPGVARVIMQEDVEREGDTVRLLALPGNRPHIRFSDSDFPAGAVLVPQGERLTPRLMVAAAGADRAVLSVSRRPTVAIIATGDELVAPGDAHCDPDTIPQSVSYGVAAMAREAGALVASVSRVRDDLALSSAAATAALECADVVVVSGGASAGERDFGKAMFASSGLDLLIAKVAIKPGKPVWLGRAGGKWVLGLPGNPTAAMVAARLFMQPLLAALMGQAQAAVAWRRMTIASDLPQNGDRECFVRAMLDRDGLIAVQDQDSSAQLALCHADWLIRRRAGDAALSAGASSAGEPARFIGDVPAASVSNSSLPRFPTRVSTAVISGATQFTRMPYPPHSAAAARVNIWTAALSDEYDA